MKESEERKIIPQRQGQVSGRFLKKDSSIFRSSRREEAGEKEPEGARKSVGSALPATD